MKSRGLLIAGAVCVVIGVAAWLIRVLTPEVGTPLVSALIFGGLGVGALLVVVGAILAITASPGSK